MIDTLVGPRTRAQRLWRNHHRVQWTDPLGNRPPTSARRRRVPHLVLDAIGIPAAPH